MKGEYGGRDREGGGGRERLLGKMLDNGGDGDNKRRSCRRREAHAMQNVSFLERKRDTHATQHKMETETQHKMGMEIEIEEARLTRGGKR